MDARPSPKDDDDRCPRCGGSFEATKVDWELWKAQLKSRGIEVRGGDADEAPACYKGLPDVLRYHGDTIRILHELRPLGVVMAGADVEDLYRD